MHLTTLYSYAIIKLQSTHSSKVLLNATPLSSNYLCHQRQRQNEGYEKGNGILSKHPHHMEKIRYRILPKSVDSTPQQMDKQSLMVRSQAENSKQSTPFRRGFWRQSNTHPSPALANFSAGREPLGSQAPLSFPATYTGGCPSAAERQAEPAFWQSKRVRVCAGIGWPP